MNADPEWEQAVHDFVMTPRYRQIADQIEAEIKSAPMTFVVGSMFTMPDGSTADIVSIDASVVSLSYVRAPVSWASHPWPHDIEMALPEWVAAEAPWT